MSVPTPGDTTLLRKTPAPPPPRTDSDSLDERLQFDRAMAVHLLGKACLDREALRAVLVLQTELLRYGDFTPLRDLLERAGALGKEAVRELGKIKLEELIHTREWERQPIPGYDVVGRLAVGTDAPILLATPRESHEKVALKVMHGDRARDAKAFARFQREADLLASLEHPRLVPARDHGTMVTRLDGVEVPYVAFDHVSGESLEQACATRGPLPPVAAATIVVEVAEALDFLLGQGYAHGDVRPEHILVDDSGHARLCDLGLAGKPKNPQGPEIFALGLVFHAMLAGHPRIPGTRPEETVAARIAAGLKPPSTDDLETPGQFLEVLQKMLHADPAQRYATYGEVAEALRPQIA